MAKSRADILSSWAVWALAGFVLLAGPARAADAPPAKTFVKAQYAPRQLEPALLSHAEALAAQAASSSPQRRVKAEAIAAALKTRLPAFYVKAGSAVSTLLSADELSAAAAFAETATGRQSALADFRLSEELRSQAEICLEEQKSKLARPKAGRAAQTKLAAELILGACATLRIASREQADVLGQDKILRARAYVDHGGATAYMVGQAVAPIVGQAADLLVRAGTVPASERTQVVVDIAAAVLADEARWRASAALHYAAAFSQADIAALGRFIASPKGQRVISAKDEVERTVREVFKGWAHELSAEVLAQGYVQGAAIAPEPGGGAFALPAPKLMLKPPIPQNANAAAPKP